MPPGTSAVSAGPLRAGTARQAVRACLFLGLLLPMVAVLATWGLPVGRTVHISVDGRQLTFRSYRGTVGDAVESAQITMHPGDRTVPAADTLLWPGIQVAVIRSVPLTLHVGTDSSPVQVAATTVAEALRTLGVPLGPIDRVYPDPGTALVAGMRVTVERREWRTWVEQRPVAFSSRVVGDPQLFKGDRVVRSEGRAGLDQRNVEALYANGRPAAVVPHLWTALHAPVPRVIAVGTRALVAARGDFAGREYLMLDATAYYSGPNNFGGGVGPRTAVGLLAQRGVVAVDPSLIPLGTRLFIDGYGYAVAGDTGGAIQGMRIDLCFNSYDEAIHFGRRTVKVYILDRR